MLALVIAIALLLVAISIVGTHPGTGSSVLVDAGLPTGSENQHNETGDPSAGGTMLLIAFIAATIGMLAIIYVIISTDKKG